MSGPGATQDDVVFAIEEIGCIARIGVLWLETVPFFEEGAGPLPGTSHVALAAETIAILRDGGR